MSNILFIVEGMVDEPKYIDQFIKYHKERMVENGNNIIPIVVQSYGTLIYDLYNKISEYPVADEFETIPVLLDILKSKNMEYDSQLEDYDMFSDIFLFFDLDAHHFYKRNDRNDLVYETIDELLSFFNESTDKGKLLISYPMFEAIKCFNDDCLVSCDVLLHLFDIYDVKRRGRTKFKNKYKNVTSDMYNNPFYNKLKIEKLVKYFIYCSLYLVGNKNEISNSSAIFLNQYRKFINPHNKVVILSAFPHFIVEIFGIDQYFEEECRYRLKDISELE